MSSNLATDLLETAADLRDKLDRIRFSDPVKCVYNPLDYAWEPYENYIRRFASRPKQILFLGMNPGPWGMVQTGVPFGEIAIVRDWLQIEGNISKPACEHPKRPIEGFDCIRSEVSGRRLWGLFAERFKTPEKFFENHLVINYCPLAFLEETGRNRTPDKLPVHEREELFDVCDRHLKQFVELLRPKWLIGVGAFAEARCDTAATGLNCRVGRILHPSPASPAANRDWAGAATKQLQALGVWT